MNVDIVSIVPGQDLGLALSDAPRAANVLGVQEGALEYQKDFGVDLAFFLLSEFRFQNESFKAHLVERLLKHQVNVVSVIDTVDRLYTTYLMSVGDSTGVPI